MLVIKQMWSINISVVTAQGSHLFPFRTEKLSPAAPMVLRKSGRVGRRRSLKDIRRNMDVLFLCAIVSRKTRGDRRGGRAQRGPEALGSAQVGIAADLWKRISALLVSFSCLWPPLGHCCRRSAAS